jgi:hypothetical protein
MSLFNAMAVLNPNSKISRESVMAPRRSQNLKFVAMAEFDWSEFITRVPVSANVKDLYKAWATRKGIETWFLRMAEFKRPDGALRDENEMVESGDTYIWRWHGWPDEVEEKGTILTCNGQDHFRFTFGEGGICDVHIKTESGQVIVELRQSEIPTDDRAKHNFHLGCKTGWTFYLANLKSLWEGGIDLRNKNVELKNVINS